MIVAICCAATTLIAAAAAHADPDTDFAGALHSHGIYGPRDYNAWIAKISCERLSRGVDTSAQQSATFIAGQLSKGSTPEQSWQFLGQAVDHYCPEQHVVLERAAAGR